MLKRYFLHKGDFRPGNSYNIGPFWQIRNMDGSFSHFLRTVNAAFPYFPACHIEQLYLQVFAVSIVQ